MERLKKLFWEIKWHAFEIFRLLRTGQYAWFWTHKKFIGPRYDWYDGSHYAFGFWWFAITSDDWKDRARGHARIALVKLLEKLLFKKFWP